MRALLLALALALALGCADEEEMSFPLAPWHMWGTSAVVTAPIGPFAGSPPQFGTGQLARINYARPDTWSFLFASRILDVPNAAGDTIAIVRYDLIAGIGRSVVEIPEFVLMRRAWSAGAPPSELIWTTQTTTPLLVGEDPLSFRQVDYFPAQDIQCSARVVVVSQDPALLGQMATIEVHSYFSPRSHIRPEWFTDSEGDGARYRGKEAGGM